MFKKAFVLTWISIFLLSLSIGMGIFAFQQTLKVASLTAEVASNLAELASAKSAHKAKLAAQASAHNLKLGEQTSKHKTALARQASKHKAELSSQASKHKTVLAQRELRHNSDLKKQKASIKARERLRRSIAAIPILGTAIIVYFEEQDFQEWSTENPNASRAEYACEVALYSAEIVDELVAEVIEASQRLPEVTRPDAVTLKARLEVPRCS